MAPQVPPSAERIRALHQWYCENVMPLRLTPEVERLWFEWLKAGYCGPDLRDVVLYIRRQISTGKRNEGALKLTNLIQRSEAGFIGFDQDLGLARSRRNLQVDRRLAPAPDAPLQLSGSKAAAVLPQPQAPAPAAEHKPNLDALRRLREAVE